MKLTSGPDNHTVEEVIENAGIPDSDPGLVGKERHPSRAAVRRVTDKVKEWTRILVVPLDIEVVTTAEL